MKSLLTFFLILTVGVGNNTPESRNCREMNLNPVPESTFIAENWTWIRRQNPVSLPKYESGSGARIQFHRWEMNLNLESESRFQNLNPVFRMWIQFHKTESSMNPVWVQGKMRLVRIWFEKEEMNHEIRASATQFDTGSLMIIIYSCFRWEECAKAASRDMLEEESGWEQKEIYRKALTNTPMHKIVHSEESNETKTNSHYIKRHAQTCLKLHAILVFYSRVGALRVPHKTGFPEGHAANDGIERKWTVRATMYVRSEHNGMTLFREEALRSHWNMGAE